mgnify:CR=1 FL=1
MTLAYMYGKALESLADKKIDFVTDDAVVLLLDNGHTLDQDTHQYISDVSTDEIVDASYSRQALANKSSAYSSGTKSLKLDCDDILWTSLTGVDIRYAVFAMDTGADNVSPLLCIWDFEADYNPVANNFSLTIHASGLITATLP